jgi:hypothetical protein
MVGKMEDDMDERVLENRREKAARRRARDKKALSQRGTGQMGEITYLTWQMGDNAQEIRALLVKELEMQDMTREQWDDTE